MQEESRRLLARSIEQVARDVAGRLRAVAAPLQDILRERATADASPERRKRIATIADTLARDWNDALASFDAAYRDGAEIAAGWRNDPYDSDGASLGALTLIDDDQVEWDMSLSGAVQRMKAAAGEALTEVDQRIAALRGIAAGADSLNPLGVDVVGKGIGAVLEKLLPDGGDRRALLVYFEPLCSGELATLYAELNEALAAQGLKLPQRARPAAAAPGARAGSAGSPAPGSSAAGLGGVGADPVAGDFLGLIQQLAQGGAVPAAYSAAAGGAAGAAQVPLMGAAALPAGMPMMAVPAAMVEALNRLQELDLGSLQGGAHAVGEGAGNALHELRKQEFVRQLPPVDVATIDIVAILFDFIFEDQLIPDAVKALVGRLQIPLLKVAMVDKTFFARREHPARVVLDTISKLSIAAGKEIDRGSPLFEQIRTAVNTILTGFETEPGIFESLVPELQALLAEQEAHVLELAERSRQVAEAQEREDLGESWSERAFNGALAAAGEDNLPPHIVDFLSRHWKRVLKFAYMKGGAEGHPWALAVGTLNDLLWSIKPKADTAERKRLVAQLPDLLRRTGAYLDRVEVAQETKQTFMDALGDVHLALIKGGGRGAKSRGRPKQDVAAAPSPAATRPVSVPVSQVSATISSADLPEEVVITRTVQGDGLEVESIALSGRVLDSRPVRPSDISNVDRGDWVEFAQQDAASMRGRLAWVSPQRGIMVFTNPQTSRAISISPEALALQMKLGLARKLEDSVALVDRALGKAIKARAA